MLIRYIFGPRSGETEHVDRNSAKPLILAGLAEAVDPADLKDPNDGVVNTGSETYRLPRAGDSVPVTMNWLIEAVLMDAAQKQSWLAIRRQLVFGKLVRSTEYCFRPPDFVHDRKYHTGEGFCSNFGCPVPPQILDEYKRQWKSNPHLRAPFEGRPVSNRPEDEKADKTGIETVASAKGSAGVLEGQLLVNRPGART